MWITQTKGSNLIDLLLQWGWKLAMTSAYELQNIMTNVNSPKNEKMINISPSIGKRDIQRIEELIRRQHIGNIGNPSCSWDCQYIRRTRLQNLGPNLIRRSIEHGEFIGLAFDNKTTRRILQGILSTIDEMLTVAPSKPLAWPQEYEYKDLADSAVISRNQSSRGMVWSCHRMLGEQDQWKDWIKQHLTIQIECGIRKMYKRTYLYAWWQSGHHLSQSSTK